MYIGSQQLMKEYDQALLDSGYSIIELVNEASNCLLKHFRNLNHVCLVCGTGNNGADGYSLAEKLFILGKDVYVVVVGNVEKFSEAANYYYERLAKRGVPHDLINEDNFTKVIAKMATYYVIGDAMFGFGLNGTPRGIYGAIIKEINNFNDKEVIAIDIPTGLDCNSGKPYESVIKADKTISLTAFKNGFLNPDSQEYTGEVFVEKLDCKDFSEEVGLFKLIELDDVKKIIKERKFDGHKGDYGRVLSITGCSRYKGAALLNTKASVYCGSGVVTLMSDQDVNNALAIACPEATSLVRGESLLKEDLEKYQSILIGCGLGLENEKYLFDVLNNSDQPLVIDADGLTMLSNHMGLLENNERTIVLTPHMGEMNRLEEIDHQDLLKYVNNFAKRYNVILVLKGPYTMISDGKHSYRIHSGNKAMSVGGMGDTLAGMINSFLGQGYEPIEAVILAVYLHGYIGDDLAQDHYSVIPSELIELIPSAMNKLLKS